MSETQYFYAEGSDQRGPVGATQLIALNLAPSTLIWREGLANWQRFDSIPEFAPQPQAASAPPPPPLQATPFPQMQTPYPNAPYPNAPYPAAQIPYTNLPPRDNSNRIVAGIFGILLGAFGVHKFILGYTTAGLIMCLITIFTCGYGGFVFGIIGLIEGIIYLSTSDEDFYQRYIVNKRPWF
jgi:TM2 domain-containing membrane protein YozV